MSFLQPIWLWAISGIIIPIAIHFWNIKEGKAFPVGSIILLDKSTKKYTRSLRINEWLLLILRCLLIILLSLLLAKPVKQQAINNKGWILIDKYHTNKLYSYFKTTIDSLLNNGFELHSFDNDFKQENLNDALADEGTSTSKTLYWQLIKNADDKLPASFPLYVFTSNKIKHFKGERPEINADVKWFAYSEDTSIKQVVKAWRLHDNTDHAMLMSSMSSGNVFSYDEVLQNSAYKIVANNLKPSLVYNAQQDVAIDTTTLQVCIYAGNSVSDAGYVNAALDAIKSFTKLPVQITVVNRISSLPQKPDWLFWLSDEALPKNIVTKNAFRYAKGKAINEISVINANYSQKESISINKIITIDTANNTPQQTLWQDGFGNPLLTKQNNVYEFYSRFNPQWNDLVWSDAFPQMLLQLIFEGKINSINTSSPDERIVDAIQMQPVFVNKQGKLVAVTTKDLSTIFWIIIFLLFCAERIVSFNTKNKTTV